MRCKIENKQVLCSVENAGVTESRLFLFVCLFVCFAPDRFAMDES